MKFGIFLGYAPEQKLIDQGLGRLLSFILKAVVENGSNQVVVAMPEWYREAFEELITDHHIELNNIEILTTDRIPLAVRLRGWLLKKKKNKLMFLSKFKLLGRQILKKIIVKLASSTLSLRVAFLLSFLFFPLLILFFLVASVAGFFSVVVMFLAKRLKKYLLPISGKIFLPAKHVRSIPYVESIYDSVRKIEFTKLIDKINKRKDVGSWFIPTVFWPEVKDIKARKVITLPDVVLYDFPTGFKEKMYRDVLLRAEETISNGSEFICYSEYVKRSHLCDKFDVLPEQVSVINHGFVDMSPYIKGENLTVTSKKIVSEYISDKYFGKSYLNGFPLQDSDFIIYASQNRPHKNILRLIKAYKCVLRERYIPIKLVLTGRVYEDRVIREYIFSNRLENDVISLVDVSSTVLAALNHLAIAHVNPSFFEGGFPFTFTEAYSVGTPSVMGDIPVTAELIDRDKEYIDMFFNPLSIEDMQNKIEYVIKNRDEAFKAQGELYERFKARSWESVAKEYVKVILGKDLNG